MSGDDPEEPRPTWETYQQPGSSYGQSPYGQSPYGQSPYGQSPYGQVPYGMAPMPHPQANTAMILGIVGLVGTFLCGILVVLGPFAWAMGARARREIDAEPHRWSGRSEATTGYVTGIITTSLLGLLVVGLILMIGLFAAVGV